MQRLSISLASFLLFVPACDSDDGDASSDTESSTSSTSGPGSTGDSGGMSTPGNPSTTATSATTATTVTGNPTTPTSGQPPTATSGESSDTGGSESSVGVSSTGGGSGLVVMETSMGTLSIELFAEEAPITVENFIAYIDSGFYDGTDSMEPTVFHRVIPGFVIQGGGLTADLAGKATMPPIVNEHGVTGLTNVRGTLSMARTNDPNSATSQFFVNVVDNANLDTGDGYAVFAQVVEGMDVVDAIVNVPTTTVGQFSDVPVDAITITSVTLE